MQFFTFVKFFSYSVENYYREQSLKAKYRYEKGAQKYIKQHEP